MLANVAAVAVLVALFVRASVAGTNPISTLLPPQTAAYLLSVPSDVEYYQWTAGANHSLTGTWQTAQITDSQGTVASASFPLTGTRDGSTVTISVAWMGAGPSWIGTEHGDTLTITEFHFEFQSAGCATHYVLHRATIQEYNTAVNALRKRAAAGRAPYVASTTCNS